MASEQKRTRPGTLSSSVTSFALLVASILLALIAWLYPYRSPAASLAADMTWTQPTFPPPPPIPTADGPVQLRLPPTEDRKHRYFTLDNGLEVVVVSDPNSDKAAASMDVGVGHLSDPDDLPGCAHFCEHLMFMGTKKYPSENEYQRYLSAHSGGSNAWTAMTSTNYYFDVAPDALEGALDRFAGFFVEPLFAEDCTEREIQAVNSEHKKNLQNDLWRMFQLEKSLSKPGHPYGKFGTGNLESLWSIPKEAGRDPRQQLIEWWEREYCARRMKLAVAGRDDLDALERMVRERFDRVPIRTEGNPPTGPNGVRITFEDHPFGPAQRSVVTFAKPVREVRALEIALPVPDLHHLHGVKPFNFLAHFLGHEGKGSVLSYLKRQGWVNSLRAGNSHEASGFAFFKVTVELTPDGLEHWKDVSLAIFKYMALLRESPPSAEPYDEIRRLADISFRFAERGKTRDYVTHLTSWMQAPVPRDKIVSANYLLDQYDPTWIQAAIQLLDPRQAAIGVTCQQLPKDVEGSFDKKEAVYGTQYHQQPLEETFLKEAVSGAAIPDLYLPGANLFVPEKFDVNKREIKEPAKRPELLRDSEVSRLWYKQDDRFWLPKTNLYCELHSPLLDVTPRNAVLGRVLVDLFNDATTEDVYDAELADLSFGLHYIGEAISVIVSGYTDKLALLTETMLKKLMAFEADPERFEKIVYQIKLHWQNFPLSEPYTVGMYWAAYVPTQVVWTQQEKLKEIEFVTPQDVTAFARELFTRLYIEALVHGNTSREEANALVDIIERTLGPRALSPGEKGGKRTLLLPENSEYVWEIPVANPAEVNNCVIYHTYVGEATDPFVRSRLSLLGQIAAEPAFNVLRTKEQLGYIVQAAATANSCTVGFRVLVQSERDAGYVESRIESWLEGFQKTLEDMTDEEFERHRQSLITKKEEKPKNLGEESRQFWNRIIDRYYEFGKKETDIAQLKTATKAEVLELFNRTINPASETRRKFSTHMKSQSRGTKGEKVDMASLQELSALFAKHGVAVDQTGLQALLAKQPDISAVREFGTAAVKQASGAAALSAEAVAELEAGIAGLKSVPAVPADTSGGKPNERNVYIDDVHAFKARLVPSKAAFPVEPLVVSKL